MITTALHKKYLIALEPDAACGLPQAIVPTRCFQYALATFVQGRSPQRHREHKGRTELKPGLLKPGNSNYVCPSMKTRGTRLPIPQVTS